MRIACACVCFFVSVVAACSNDETPAQPTDSGADVISEAGMDSAPADTAVDAPSDAPSDTMKTPNAETCQKFVEATCNAKTAACCPAVGFGWKPDTCKATMTAYCQSWINDYKAGISTYDESHMAGCLAGWDSSLTACKVDSPTAGENTLPCQHWFNGVKKAGATCDGKSISECEAPDGLGAYCDIPSGAMTGTCVVYGFSGKDQPCKFSGSPELYCKTGLYCDMTATPSLCKEQKALGAACSGPDDQSCGINACKDLKCTARLPEGSACTTWNDCQSYNCQMSKCTKVYYSSVSSAMCDGT